MTAKHQVPNAKSSYWQQWSEIGCCAKSNKVWSFIDLNRCCLLLFHSFHSWKNCYLRTLKFKLEREISWWQTHKLIIWMIIGRTARMQLEIYPESGCVMTTYSYYTEILNWPLLCSIPKQWRIHCSREMWRDVYRSNTPQQGKFPF